MKFLSQGKQLSIAEFCSSLSDLNKSNRWVRLGDSLPWDEIEQLYNRRLNNGKRGAGNKPARMIIGALLIKHKMNLSDEETILAIQENPYMQYFVGLSEFTDRPIFDPSLFVTIRKRLGTSDFNDMSVSLLTMQLAQAHSAADSNKKKQKDEDPPDSGFTDQQGRYHEGSLKIDATCADAEVRYPTDIDLLHDGCKVIDRYIRKLCKLFALPLPPTSYTKARPAYLEVIKRKKKSKQLLCRGKSSLLTYLMRDIRCFAQFIGTHGTHLFYRLNRNERRIVGAILKMYYQQEYMFKSATHSCPDRIISIFQSHIRPIVRGKSKSPTEFGAKMGASIVRGYTFIDHHSWDAYNESSDLALQIELYRKRFGFLPAKLHADRIYLNRKNRKLLKELEIQAIGKPLGRPSKSSQTQEHKSKLIQEAGQRNEIEATFGTGKRVYRANNIRAKLPETANSWTGMCYFVKNVMKFLRELCYAIFIRIKLMLNPDNIYEKKYMLMELAG